MATQTFAGINYRTEMVLDHPHPAYAGVKFRVKFDTAEDKTTYVKELRAAKAQGLPIPPLPLGKATRVGLSAAETRAYKAWKKEYFKLLLEREAPPDKGDDLIIETEALADSVSNTDGDISPDQWASLAQKGWKISLALLPEPTPVGDSDGDKTPEEEELPDLGASTPKKDPKADGVEMYGLVVEQMTTDCRFLQEGVSLFWDKGVEKELAIELTKKEKVLIHLENQTPKVKQDVGFPAKGRVAKEQFAKALNELKVLVMDYAEKLVGQSFQYGDVIFQGFGSLLRHRKLNQPLRVTGVSIEEAPFQNGAFFVKLEMILETSSTWKKIRGMGVKATLVPASTLELEVVSEEHKSLFENVVIIHSASGLKGKPLDLVMFSHAVGGAELCMEEGVIVPKTGVGAGKAFDITRMNSIVDKWRNKTAKRVLMSMNYARAEWEFIQECDAAAGLEVGQEGYDIVKVVDIDEKTVRITFWMEVLIGKAPLNFEVSLPEENSGLTGMTQEMVACLTLQDREIGELLNSMGETKRNSIVRVLQMAQGAVPSGAPQVNLLKQEDLKALPISTFSMTDAEVFKAWARAFPSGVTLVSASDQSLHKQFLHFDGLMGIATFVGGSGDGVSHQVAQFLRWVPTQVGKSGYESTIHGEWALTCKGLKGWFLAQLESKSLRKKLVSGLKGLAFGAKIRTLPLPCLSHTGDIPWVAINPQDELLMQAVQSPFTKEIPQRFLVEVQPEVHTNKKGQTYAALPKGETRKVCAWTVLDKKDEEVITQKRPIKDSSIISFWVFDPYKVTGELVSLFRTPMVMQGVCQVVITEEVGVGHLGLLMHVWAMFNEGDSDGDGVAFFPLFHYFDHLGVSMEERLERAARMNRHLLGMGGYAFCYGPDRSKWPCAEFVNHYDAHTKKAIIVLPGSEAEKVLVKKGILPYVREKKVGEWIGAVTSSNAHYTFNVSKGYNIAVVALNAALELQYQEWNGTLEHKEALTVAIQTAAVCWRLVYEGKGLAGADPASQKWFSLLAMSAFFQGWTPGWDGRPTAPGKETPKSLIKGFGESLLEGLGLEPKEHRGIGRLLVKYSSILADQKALENPDRYSYRLEEMSDGEKEQAFIHRTLRVLSQGQDATLESLLEGSEEDYSYAGDEEEAPLAMSPLKEFITRGLHEKLACTWQAKLAKQAALFSIEASKMVSSAKQAREDYTE